MKNGVQAKVPKRSPEELGYKLVPGGLYVRTDKMLRCAQPVSSRSSESCRMEIGNLNKDVGGFLAPGNADVEVLCNRQTVLGNPFSMLRVKEIGKGSKPQECEEDRARQLMCNVFDKFFDSVVAPETNGCLVDIAKATAQRLGQSPGIIAKDWVRDFGSRSCKEFRATYNCLGDLVVKHAGRVRLLCHCVPLRCHTQTIADKLYCSTANASTDNPESCPPVPTTDFPGAAEGNTTRHRRWAKTSEVLLSPHISLDAAPSDSISVGPSPGMSGVGSGDLYPSRVEREPLSSTHAEPATASMTSEQKEILKLQKVLRQISLLEQERDSGAKLEQNQLAKIEKKTWHLERLTVLGVDMTQANKA